MKKNILLTLLVFIIGMQAIASTSDTITLYSQFLKKESKFVVITPTSNSPYSKSIPRGELPKIVAILNQWVR
jgi:hypothetical protein